MAALPEPFNTTVQKIYDAYAEREEPRRRYLGPSTLSNDCDRALWYDFRWATDPEKFSGRMLRLFDTGHREESRLIADLKRIGVHVREFDPATGKQWEVKACGGHIEGHMDGVLHGLPEAPTATHILECKTHNEKSFKALVTQGVKKAKPGHYRQMMIYMHLYGAERAFYLAQNKNTDELYGERVSYDALEAMQLFARMERIVTAAEPPPKLHEKPNPKTARECEWCVKADICHGGEWAKRSCRTCLHSTPDTHQGGWRCELGGFFIERETEATGCKSHLFIPGLVPGEQIDADAEANTVTYRLRTGGTWVDGKAEVAA